MPRHPRRSRRLLIPLVLATVLAGEVAGLAAAAALDAPRPASSAAPRVQAASGADVLPTARSAGAARSTEGSPPESRRTAPASVLAARGTTADHARPSRIGAAAPRPNLAASAKSVTAGASARQGRNHVWIPALGINRSVESFPCSRTRPPDNYVYRWGCAGRNNV